MLEKLRSIKTKATLIVTIWVVSLLAKRAGRDRYHIAQPDGSPVASGDATARGRP